MEERLTVVQEATVKCPEPSHSSSTSSRTGQETVAAPEWMAAGVSPPNTQEQQRTLYFHQQRLSSVSIFRPDLHWQKKSHILLKSFVIITFTAF